MSADGKVLVGVGRTANGLQSWRWSAIDGLNPLGTLIPNTDVIFGTGQTRGVRAVSADGTILAGSEYGLYLTGPEDESGWKAWIWTSAAGFTVLGGLPQAYGTETRAISANGQVVVGAANTIAGPVSWRWTAESGMIGIGALDNGGKALRSYRLGARFVSSDGSVTAGTDETPVYRGWRWTASGGLVPLGLPPGICCSEVTGMSADGSVLVGIAYRDDAVELEPWRWTVADGMKMIRTDFGLDLSGWECKEGEPVLVSGDGSTLTGTGIRPDGWREAWILRLPGAATSPGTEVVVQPRDPVSGAAPVTLTFSEVTAAGTTTVTTSSTGTPPPAGFKLGEPPIYCELSTSAGFSGPVQVCFNYAQSTYGAWIQLK